MTKRFSGTKLQPYVTIRLSGTGGQGLILAGRLLAEAASIYEGLNVVQTNSYGPEARGGASRSEVVIGKGQIDILHSPVIDALVCLSQQACDAYYGDLSKDGLLITDSMLVGVVPTARAVEVPVTELAQKVGNKMTANVIALGVLASITGIVKRDSLKAAVAARAPKAFLELNVQAVDAGYQAAEAVMGKWTAKRRGTIPNFSHIRE
jgi:Pyruvate:ferredoxin oxidoreductase and related 2-oxoacid:ferredoxin oxidoreductases, gamma subunit